jgi:hypothetical protein
MIILAAFSMDMYVVDFWESVILDTLHYRFNQSFRCGFDNTIQCPTFHPAGQQEKSSG